MHGVRESNKNYVISISYCVIAFLGTRNVSYQTLLPVRVGGAAGHGNYVSMQKHCDCGPINPIMGSGTFPHQT